MSSTIYTFIRHAESIKNLKDITGGKGDNLTLQGIRQVNDLINYIKDTDFAREYGLFSSDIIQARETADLIAKGLNISNTVTSELNPASMGVISGLPMSQIEKRYPTIFNQLIKWRKKEIEAIDLDIPGMEKPYDFYQRITSFIHSIDNGDWNILICTRSLMVLIYNITHNRFPIRGGGYRHQDIENCQLISFTIDNNIFSIIDSVTSKELR